MNRISALPLVGLLVAAPLVLGAGVAGAQQDARSSQAQDQAAQNAMKSNTQKDPLAMQGSGGPEWDSLKGHDKGYVLKQDALPNSWLALNFTKCDKDRNGKVTDKEYEKCRNPQR